MIKSGCWNCKNRRGQNCSIGCTLNKIEPFSLSGSLWKDVIDNLNGKTDNFGIVVGSGCINLVPKLELIKETVQFT